MNDAGSGGFQALDTWTTLARFAREEAQRLMQRLLEEEAAVRLAAHRAPPESGAGGTPGRGCRSGHGRPRRLRTVAGDLRIRRPRLRGLSTAFRSDVLPSFTRRFREEGALQIEQYLAGLATGDFDAALSGLLGGPSPLPESAMARLRRAWEAEHRVWRSGPLNALNPVYLWIDRLDTRITPPSSGLLVAIARLPGGESRVLELCPAEAWSPSALLHRLRERGLDARRLVVGGGNLGLPARRRGGPIPTRASR